jgi:hypothetical protein
MGGFPRRTNSSSPPRSLLQQRLPPQAPHQLRGKCKVKAELDHIDIDEGLVSKVGSHGAVLNVVSLHGGLTAS